MISSDTRFHGHWGQASTSKVRQRLASKHQDIAERLKLMLARKVKEHAQVIPATNSDECGWTTG